MMEKRKAARCINFLFAAGALVFLGVKFAVFAEAAVSGEIDHMFNASWNLNLDGSNKYLSYGMNPNTFTKVSGSFCDKNTGLALGINVDVNTEDNAVGKADRMMGYLGYRKTYLRFQRGSLNGSYRWAGSLAPGMKESGLFEQSITHVDMLFWKPRLFGMPGFLGIGYTSFAIPVEVQTLYTPSDKAHQKNGVYVYDPDYKASFYSFIFGFDTFSEALANMKGALSTKEGFGAYLSGEDRIGFGSSQLGKDAVANARALNPGLTPVTESFFSAIIENDTSMGIRWLSKGGSVGIAAGYEVSFIANFNFTGAAEKPGDLGFDVFASLMRHGPVSRLYVRW